jgi:hypothetical protein
MLAALEINGGVVEYDAATGGARMTVPATPKNHYTNAQLDDYHDFGGLVAPRWPRRRPFARAAPLRLSLRARASHAAPVGTLGFGYWNEPFSITGSVLSAPSVVWFFYASPPSDMALVPGVPGQGWKAATLTTGRWPSLLLAPGALAAILLTRLPGLGRPVMHLARRFVQAHEAPLADVALDQWHSYELDWRETEARFIVDGMERLRSPAPSKRPLGFIMWIDNQYAVASEDGHFGLGVRPLAEPQWLEVADLKFGV